MRARRSIAQGVMMAVIAGSAFLTGAAPASAGGGDPVAVLYVVHGIPGVRVDVCIARVGEVTSRLPYGERVRVELAPGDRTLRLRRASRGTCKGDVVARRVLALDDGDNATAVSRLDRRNPVITRFENDVAPTEVGQMRLTAAHMMRGTNVDVLVNGVAEIQDLARGTTGEVALAADTDYAVWGAKAGTATPIVGPRVIESTPDGRAFTFVMVGTKVENSRAVVFKQNVGVTT